MIFPEAHTCNLAFSLSEAFSCLSVSENYAEHHSERFKAVGLELAEATLCENARISAYLILDNLFSEEGIA